MADSKRTSNMRLRSRMLSGADEQIDIDEYRREFKYLKLPKVNFLSVEDDKRRFIFVYFLRRVMILSLVAISLSILLCLLTVNLGDVFIGKAYNIFWDVRNVWPWNDSLQWQLNNSGLMNDPDQERFVIACSLVSLTWIIWLSAAMYYGALKAKWYSKNLNGFLWMFAAASAISWSCSAYGLFNKPSLGPSVHDNISMLVVKMIILISISYFSLGIFLFSFFAKTKDLIRGRENG